MQPQLATFKRFPDAIQAKELEQLLKDKNIPCEYLEVSSGLDSSFSSEFSKEYVIKVLPDDFEKATQVVEELAARWANEVPADYYLFSFTNEELQDLVRKKFEWSEFDYQLAKKILADRGLVVDETELKQEHKQQLFDAALPEKVPMGWIILGFALSCFGGLFGVLSGYVISTAKKNLPDGRTVYTYAEYYRNLGRNMMFLGIVVFVILSVIQLLAFV